MPKKALHKQAALADKALAAGDTRLAAGYLDAAYEAGLAAWDEFSGLALPTTL